MKNPLLPQLLEEIKTYLPYIPDNDMLLIENKMVELAVSAVMDSDVSKEVLNHETKTFREPNL